MDNENRPAHSKSSTKKVILITLLVMLALVLIWQVLLPVLGISMAISAGLIGILVATVVLICVSALLFLVFSGIGIFIFSGFVFFWTIVAIVLFPLLFPILIPLLLLMFVIGYLARGKSRDQ